MAAEHASKMDAAMLCRAVRARSAENQAGMALMSGGTSSAARELRRLEPNLHALALGILRQELDSMVRLLFLRKRDSHERSTLLSQMARGERWALPTANGGNRFVTDKDMVDHAQSLHGWTERVYKFGCSMIHLSKLHDYSESDPFAALPLDEREVIVGYLNNYHHVDLDANSSFDEIMRLAPRILDKISSNLEFEVQRLEALYN